MSGRLRVLVFSVLREVVGGPETEVEWPEEGGSVQELLDRLYDRHPGLREWDRNLLVAVDLAYAGRGERIVPGQEVAVMPPVQGG
jgi:molybdopterin converting factor small subunit